MMIGTRKRLRLNLIVLQLNGFDLYLSSFDGDFDPTNYISVYIHIIIIFNYLRIKKIKYNNTQKYYARSCMYINLVHIFLNYK